MLRHINTYESLNSFKMKVLSFLIICFIASSNIVSTSKGGQSFLGGKEDLPTFNKQRKLVEYKGGYIKVYYNNCNYGQNAFLDSRIASRKSISKITVSGSNTDVKESGYNSQGSGVEFTIYFESQITNLERFFNAYYDSDAVNIKSVDFSNFDSSKILYIIRIT